MKRCPKRVAASRRGIALPLVLAVLVCLIAVAIPFSISMRHEHGAVSFRSYDDEARRTAESVRDLALARLGETAPDRDPTPWADDPAEVAVDVEQAARELGIEPLGPRGRLLSAQLEDHSGRIDLNRASLFLIARLLGLSTRLSSKLQADDQEIRLEDGSFLQDEGFLWIDGEVTYYRARERNLVSQFTRPAVVPGVWEPALMSPDPREFEAGTEVLDFRAWMVAAWLFKAEPGRESSFQTLSQPMSIARFGRGALGPEQRMRLERHATVFGADGGRDRFGNAQRVFNPIVAGQTATLLLEQGHFVGRGTICRVRTVEGRTEHVFVRRSQRTDLGFNVDLEMPLTIAADAYQAVADFLLPRPVNVNACSREVLLLLLEGLALNGQRDVDERTAALVADRIVAARPLAGMRDLIALLDTMVEEEKTLEGSQRTAILMNAEHSGAFPLETGTAPFAFASDGVVDLNAAASLNFELNGREKARAFLREVIATAGAGRSHRVFATQRDFDEPWRILRAARGWTTFPENLQVWDGGLGSADPPSRLPAMLPQRSRFPSEELNETGVRLAAGRMLVSSMTDDRTWHFDGGRGDREGRHPDGWRLADGPLNFSVEGGRDGVQLVQDNGRGPRPRPFGVSMWWNPGQDVASEQILFDWKCNSRAPDPELHDRVTLRLVGGKLEFEVNDAFLRESEQDRYTSKIVYDFTDGLPLEGDTWYHVTAFCRGNRAGEMCLWVDGRPRGKYSHWTRLDATFNPVSSGTGRMTIDVERLAEGVAKFPDRGPVRVGLEIFDYTEIRGSQLTVSRDDVDHFGGVRPPPNQVPGSPTSGGSGGTTRVAETGVRVYGYSARLTSDVPEGSGNLDSNGLGRFGVAMVDPALAKTNITVTGANGFPLDLGMGFECDVQQLDLRQLDGNQLGNDDKTFQEGGGFALLVSYEFRLINARNPIDGTSTELDEERTALGSIIGGIEVIWYAGFDGKSLTGVRRGQTMTSDLAQTDFVEQNQTAVFPYALAPLYCDKHAFIQAVNPQIFSGYEPIVVPVLVIPIGVRVGGTGVDQHFLVPEPVTGGTDLAEMLQIGSEFNDDRRDSTEWVRYNAIVRDNGGGWNFLRSDPEAISWMRAWLEGHYANNTQDSDQFNGVSAVDQLYQLADAIANNSASGYAPGGSEYDLLVEGINFEDVVNPGARNSSLPGAGSRLAFRGVLETGDSEHSGSRETYPVFRTSRAGAIPGRYDEVTLLGTQNERPERHILNYAWSKPGAEDWDNDAHVAFLATAAGTRFVATPSLAINASTAQGLLANITDEADSRNFARLNKFPSGELPSVWDGASDLVIGGGGAPAGRGGAAGGSSGAGGPMFDEVRIFAPEDPVSTFAHGMYILRRDVSVSEQDRIEMLDDALRFPGTTIGGLAYNLVHGDASVWQLGDDFIVGAERTMGKPVVQDIAESGRTFLGGEPGFHEAGESAMLLPWLAMTRLGGGFSATDSLIDLVSPENFPRSGYALIDQEVLAYSDLRPGGGAAQMYVPSYLEDPEGRSSQFRGPAALRGRFGTPAQSHSPDAVVFFWPWRYHDGYVPRCDIPEMATYEIPVAARRALFHSLTWKVRRDDPLVTLIATARVQGRGGFTADPEDDPDLFVFDKPGTPEEPNRIDRQGDLLRLRFHVDYRDGALDPVDFARNSWKRAPLLEVVGVEYVADRVVELHEESR